MALGRLIIDGINPVLKTTGLPDVGAELHVYLAGTSSYASLYADAAGATAVANPQSGANAANAAGRFHVQTRTFWADDANAYDIRVVHNDGSADELFEDIPVAGSADTYSAGGTGAVVRTAAQKLRERVSAEDYGWDEDNSTAANLLAAQRAINSISTGGIVNFGPRQADISGTLAITTPNVCLEGDGDASVINTTSATLDILQVSAERVNIEGLAFATTATRTAGAYVKFLAGAYRCRLQHFNMIYPFIGVEYADASLSSIHTKHGRIWHTKAATGVGIDVTSGTDDLIEDVFFYSETGVLPLANIKVRNTGDLRLVGVQATRALRGLLVEPGAGQVVVSLQGSESFFDNCGEVGADFHANGAGAFIGRSRFIGCWFGSAEPGGSTGDGARFRSTGGGSINGLRFIGCEAHDNARDGWRGETALATDIQWIGCEAGGNGGAAVRSTVAVTGWRGTQNKFGPISGMGANDKGIDLHTSSSSCVWTENELRSNTTSAYSGPVPSATVILKNNLGHVTEAEGTVSGVPNGSGELTFNPGLSVAPNTYQLTPYGSAFIQAQVVGTPSASSITIVLLDAAGSPITAASRSVYWRVAA